MNVELNMSSDFGEGTLKVSTSTKLDSFELGCLFQNLWEQGYDVRTHHLPDKCDNVGIILPLIQRKKR